MYAFESCFRWIKFITISILNLFHLTQSCFTNANNMSDFLSKELGFKLSCLSVIQIAIHLIKQQAN